MARLSDVLGNARRMDLIRYANNEAVPKRGKKKFRTQMSKKEIDYLFTRLKSVKKWVMSPHALDRIEEKGIEATYDDVVSTIHNALIVEYHVAKYNEKDDIRVVIRSKGIVNKCHSLHVVFSLTRKNIVSVWMNHKDDFHDTIDMRDYDKKLKILGV